MLVSALCGSAQAQDVLTGDTALACQAILCLSSASQPAECAASLARYFSISYRLLTDTIQGRLDFLNMCPVGSQAASVSSLNDAIAHGAGRCDADSLNSELQSYTQNADGSTTTIIGNVMPLYCSAYLNNGLTYFANNLPIYVGDPALGGFWTTQANYSAALATYNANVAAAKAAALQKQLNDVGLGGDGG